METFDSLVRKAAPIERFVNYGGLVTTAFVYENQCFVKDGNFFVHADPKHDLGEYEQESSEFMGRFRSLMNAEFYRMAVTDETLPADLSDGTPLLLDHYPFFCRISMIDDLGRIAYTPACPDLREAMLHDLQPEIRQAAARALGRIGNMQYTIDLIHAMQHDKFASHAAMEGLGDMKDESAIPALMEKFQEGRKDIYLADLFHDRDRWNRGMNQIRDVTRVLAKIGGKADRCLKELSYDLDFSVRWSMEKGIEYSTID